MSKLGLIVAALCAASAMAVAYSAWRGMADGEVGGTGLLALIGAGVAALAVGGGLMALLFWSRRKGFDERAGARPELQSWDHPHRK
jgi:hypothetical protein